MHVKKPLIGAEGVGVSIELGGGQLERRESMGYGLDGYIIQEYAKLPETFDYHYMIGSWSIDGAMVTI